ncbi:hypothetical protein APHAL10511_005142 [Amanita phalloides]|nr:hypothetical protein APHAL10511_005142 [Amanita phalloides]
MDTHAGNDSPPLRSTILGSLLRGRPRNVSQSEPRELSPPPQNPRRPPRTSISNPTSPNPNTAISVAIPQPGSSTNFVPLAPSSPSAFASMLRRKPNPTPATNTAHEQQPAATTTTTSPVLPFTSPHTPQLATSLPSVIAAPSTMPSMPGALPMHSSLIPQPPPAAYNTFRIRLVPHLDSRRSLRFDAITRDLRETDPALRIGRFTDRSGMGLAAVNALGTNKLAFKSKVVSRAHAEIWVEKAGKFFIKDNQVV